MAVARAEVARIGGDDDEDVADGALDLGDCIHARSSGCTAAIAVDAAAASAPPSTAEIVACSPRPLPAAETRVGVLDADAEDDDEDEDEAESWRLKDECASSAPAAKKALGRRAAAVADGDGHAYEPRLLALCDSVGFDCCCCGDSFVVPFGFPDVGAERVDDDDDDEGEMQCMTAFHGDGDMGEGACVRERDCSRAVSSLTDADEDEDAGERY